MYRLVVLLICIFAVNALPKLQLLFREQALKSGSECLSEGIDATMDDLKAIAMHNIPTTRAGMCLLRCVHEKFGIQEPDGKISKEACMAFLEQIKDDQAYYDVAKAHFLHCIETVSNDGDKCIVGTNFMSCIVLGGKKNGMFYL